MLTRNRIFLQQSDYVLELVQTPSSWTPAHPLSIPPRGEVISRYYVASFQEAYDDLVRCNRVAMRHGLNQWAVIHATGGDL